MQACIVWLSSSSRWLVQTRERFLLIPYWHDCTSFRDLSVPGHDGIFKRVTFDTHVEAVAWCHHKGLNVIGDAHPAAGLHMSGLNTPMPPCAPAKKPQCGTQKREDLYSDTSFDPLNGD